MAVFADGFLNVGECGENRYLSKDGKQVIITGPLAIDLSTLPLLDDTTKVTGKTVTYKKRFTRENTIPLAASDFPDTPRIDYYAMKHGPWSECLPIEFGSGSEYQDTVFKLAGWKTRNVHYDAKFLSGLINNDNVVRLLSIVTVEGRFAGFGMERLYRCPVSPMEEQVKELLPGFIQETVEYLHQTAQMYHCDIRIGNIMLNGQGRLKLIDFDIAQTDVLATPHTYIPDAQFFLGVSPRLDHLDISMSIVLMFLVLSDIPQEERHELQIAANPLEPFDFYRDNNLQRSAYFHHVQDQVYGKLRALMECSAGEL
ncbi:hypothetical protein FQN55_001756 [Onygenales sp. PD_40]|nr:hypothetical protein FQN55_001756 [Onygenales sp. PD_40]